MAVPQKRLQQHCDICLQTPWYALPAEDEIQQPHHETLGALELSAKSCRMCKLVLQTALSRDEVLRGLRYDRGFWTLRSFRQVITAVGEEPQEVMFMTLFGAEMPSHEPVYADVNNEYVILATHGHGMPKSKPGAGFTRALGGDRHILAPTAVTDASGSHLKDARPYEVDVVIPEPPRKDMKVFVYSNAWSGRPIKEGEDKPTPALMGIGARIGTHPHILRETFNSAGNEMMLCGSGIGICTDNEDRFPYIPARLRAANSGSDDAFAQISKWLSDCQTSHEHCQPPPLNPFLPTRVLDVLSSERHVELVASKGSRGRYIALSHSWGSSPRITATEDTLEDLTDGIAVSFLPKTFRDAVDITKRLGIRYLWIDCLCIIQDDHKDWEREAATMGEVYRNAYLTVSASDSQDSSSGCLLPRNMDSYVSAASTSLGYDRLRVLKQEQACCISYFHKHPSESMNQLQKFASLQFFEEWLPGSASNSPQRTEIGRFGKDFDPLGSSHLSTRGWTLQERLLSRRTIHYAKDQLYFECESGIWSEDGFSFPTPRFAFSTLVAKEMIPLEQHGKQSRGASFAADIEKPQVPIRGEGGWLAMVTDYSRRKLSKPEDKLTALAGVAKLVAQQTGGRYYAGVWASHIYEDLCWRVQRYEESAVPIILKSGSMRARPVAGAALVKASRPDDYRAPTWSWASLDAPVRFEALSYGNLVARCRSCKVQPAGPDPYGRVSSGQLDIEAPLFEVFPYDKPSSLVKHGVAVYIDLEDDRRKCIGTAYPDLETSTPLAYPCYAMFIDPAVAILVRSTGKLSGIIARTMPPSEDGSTQREKLLDSIEGRRLMQERGTKNDMIMKPLYDVERIGLAVFAKGTGLMDENGFHVDDAARMEQPKPVSKKEFDPGKVKLVHGDGSWGPVRKEDLKVWLTIV